MKEPYISLFEANSRRMIADQIFRKSHKIYEHLVKIILSKSSDQSVNHWKQELFAFFESCHIKLKKVNVFPSAEFYYYQFWGNMGKNEAQRKIINIVDSIYEEDQKYNIEELYELISKIFKNISEILSRDDFNRKEFYNEVQELTGK